MNIDRFLCSLAFKNKTKQILSPHPENLVQLLWETFSSHLFACVLHNTPKKLPFPVQITLRLVGDGNTRVVCVYKKKQNLILLHNKIKIY